MARNTDATCRVHLIPELPRLKTLPHMCLHLFTALAETLGRMEAERDRLKDQLWRANAQMEAFTLRLGGLREWFRCSPEQVLLPFADDPDLEAESKAAAEHCARVEEIIVRRRMGKRQRRWHLARR